MRELRQHLAFATEAFGAAARDQREVQELDRRLAFEATIAAMREPHAAHAALPERTLERVGADALAGERVGGVGGEVQRRAFEKRLALDRGLVGEQRRELVGERRIVARKRASRSARCATSRSSSSSSSGLIACQRVLSIGP